MNRNNPQFLNPLQSSTPSDNGKGEENLNFEPFKRIFKSIDTKIILPTNSNPESPNASRDVSPDKIRESDENENLNYIQNDTQQSLVEINDHE